MNVIHIGKCGGSTVKQELTKHNIKFKAIHTKKVIYDTKCKYLIIIRNPISRFISAFNWRYHLLKNKLRPVEKEELDGLKFYGSVNNLAESLYKNNILNSEADAFINQVFSYGHPSHLGMGIYWYIGDFLTKCKKKDIFGVIINETLSEDMKRLFNIKVTLHNNNNKNEGYDTKLSDLGRANLKRYLCKDYQCIKKLKSIGFIPNGVYKILMK